MAEQFHDIHDFESFYSLIYSVYSVPNLILPVISGYFLFTYDTRVAVMTFSLLVLIGVVAQTIGCHLTSSALFIFGRFVFALGAESLVIGTQTLLTFWFIRFELAFALGLSLSLCRLGNLLSAVVFPSLLPAAVSVEGSGSSGRDISRAFVAGTLVCAGSCLFSAALVYVDAKYRGSTGTSLADGNSNSNSNSHSNSDIESPRFSRGYGSVSVSVSAPAKGKRRADPDLGTDSDSGPPTAFSVQTALLCAACFCAYGSVVPFVCSADEFVLDRYFPPSSLMGLEERARAEAAAVELQMVPFVLATVLTPVLGFMVDFLGQRTLFMVLAPVGMTAAHLLFLDAAFGPEVPLVLLGAAYGLFVGAALPCVPFVTENAGYYGLVFGALVSCQNLALWLVPAVVDVAFLGSATRIETGALWMFALCSAAGVILGVILWLDDERYHASRLRVVTTYNCCRGKGSVDPEGGSGVYVYASPVMRKRVDSDDEPSRGCEANETTGLLGESLPPRHSSGQPMRSGAQLELSTLTANIPIGAEETSSGGGLAMRRTLATSNLGQFQGGMSLAASAGPNYDEFHSSSFDISGALGISPPETSPHQPVAPPPDDHGDLPAAAPSVDAWQYDPSRRQFSSLFDRAESPSPTPSELIDAEADTDADDMSRMRGGPEASGRQSWGQGEGIAQHKRGDRGRARRVGETDSGGEGATGIQYAATPVGGWSFASMYRRFSQGDEDEQAEAEAEAVHPALAEPDAEQEQEPMYTYSSPSTRAALATQPFTSPTGGSSAAARSEPPSRETPEHSQSWLESLIVSISPATGVGSTHTRTPLHYYTFEPNPQMLADGDSINIRKYATLRNATRGVTFDPHGLGHRKVFVRRLRTGTEEEVVADTQSPAQWQPRSRAASDGCAVAVTVTDKILSSPSRPPRRVQAATVPDDECEVEKPVGAASPSHGEEKQGEGVDAPMTSSDLITLWSSPTTPIKGTPDPSSPVKSPSAPPAEKLCVPLSAEEFTQIRRKLVADGFVEKVIFPTASGAKKGRHAHGPRLKRGISLNF